MAPHRPSAPSLVWRRLEPADLTEFHRLHAAPAAPGSGTPAPEPPPALDHPDLAYSRAVLHDITTDWRRDGLGYFGLRIATGDRAVGRLVGVGGVRRAGYRAGDGTYRGDGSWNVYYRIAADHRGLGFAGVLVAAAARRCAELEPEAVLSARIHPANTASRRVAEKLGLRQVHTELTVAGEPELLFEALASAVAADGWRVSGGAAASTGGCPEIAQRSARARRR